MTSLLVVVGVVFAAAFLWLAKAALFRFGDVSESLRLICESLERVERGPGETFNRRLGELEELVDMLPRKWKDIERAALAAEGRARAHIKRVTKELNDRGFEDPGLEGAARELRLLDDDGGPDEGVRPLSEGVGDSAQPDAVAAPSPDQNWLELALAAKFGR